MRDDDDWCLYDEVWDEADHDWLDERELAGHPADDLLPVGRPYGLPTAADFIATCLVRGEEAAQESLEAAIRTAFDGLGEAA